MLFAHGRAKFVGTVTYTARRLEHYSWKAHEALLNKQLPMFRTSISLPVTQAPLRLHFIHARSTHGTAVPLLLIPPFPFTNLSLGHLIEAFTTPDDPDEHQPFHLVIPSLPGLGFSDPLPNNVSPIAISAQLLDTLMRRIGYDRYLATNAGSGLSSPAQIDWKLINYLATHYSTSCLGAHVISPPLEPPKLHEVPLEWTKWTIASVFRSAMFGYNSEDFKALERQAPHHALSAASFLKIRKSRQQTPAELGLNAYGFHEPNTMAYALCDSPTGLLVFVLKSLKMMSGPTKQFTQSEIITITQLAWLPGPEYALRFWAYCTNHDEDDRKVVDQGKKERGGVQKAGDISGERKTGALSQKPAVVRPKIAITVFLGDTKGKAMASGSVASPSADADLDKGQDADAPPAVDGPAPADTPGDSSVAGPATASAPSMAVSPGLGSIASPAPSPAGGEAPLGGSVVELPAVSPALLSLAGTDSYTCPSWANPRYDVQFVQRVSGRPGILALERPEVIVEGARGLAKALLRIDSRLKPGPAAPSITLSAVAPLSQIVVSPPLDEAGPSGSGSKAVLAASGALASPSAPAPPQQAQPASSSRATRQQPLKGGGLPSSQVLPVSSSSGRSPSAKGKGKELDTGNSAAVGGTAGSSTPVAVTLLPSTSSLPSPSPVPSSGLDAVPETMQATPVAAEGTAPLTTAAAAEAASPPGASTNASATAEATPTETPVPSGPHVAEESKREEK